MSLTARKDNIATAVDCILVATSFRKSAEVLDVHNQNPAGIKSRGMLFLPAFYYLVSHSSELFLKAALLKRGVPEESLKKSSIRHNLVKLCDLLGDNGKNLTQSTKNILKALNMGHTTHYFRYRILIKTPVYEIPTQEIFNALEELLMSTSLRED